MELAANERISPHLQDRRIACLLGAFLLAGLLCEPGFRHICGLFYLPGAHDQVLSRAGDHSPNFGLPGKSERGHPLIIIPPILLMNTTLKQGETIVKEGAANLQKNIETVGGKLYLIPFLIDIRYK